MNNITSLSCSIGIVTYLGRFEEYFKPLVRKLYFLFPDYDINVFINGHYDTVKQVQYLRDVTSFLRSYPNIRYVTNLEHQSLARGWNWLVMMSKCDRILILNDDVSFNLEFRHNLENLISIPEIYTLNGSWSHFVINKDIIRKVGWFDERFLGVGDEDGDYICRLAMQGIPLGNISIHGLCNYVAPQKDPGWGNISGITNNKYATINREFFKKKWFRSDFGPVPQNGSFRVCYHDERWETALNPELEEMPQYYSMDCLEAREHKKRSPKSFILAEFAQFCSMMNWFYWQARSSLSGCLRLVIGPRWDRWRSV